MSSPDAMRGWATLSFALGFALKRCGGGICLERGIPYSSIWELALRPRKIRAAPQWGCNQRWLDCRSLALALRLQFWARHGRHPTDEVPCLSCTGTDKKLTDGRTPWPHADASTDWSAAKTWMGLLGLTVAAHSAVDSPVHSIAEATAASRQLTTCCLSSLSCRRNGMAA